MPQFLWKVLEEACEMKSVPVLQNFRLLKKPNIDQNLFHNNGGKLITPKIVNETCRM